MVNSLPQGIIRQGAEKEWSGSDENTQSLNSKCCNDTFPWETHHHRSPHYVIYTSFMPLELDTMKGGDNLDTKQYNYSDVLSIPIAPLFICVYMYLNTTKVY